MAERPEITRLVLRYYAAQAAAVPTLFGPYLLAAAIALAPGVMAGKIVVEAAAEGTSTKYQLPAGLGSLQPQEVAAMMERLYSLYEVATGPATVAYPGGWGQALPSGIGPQDAAIVAWMLGQLTVIRSYSADHTNSGIRT